MNQSWRAIVRMQKWLKSSVALIVACVALAPCSTAQPNPNQGPGGPVLVVTSPSSTYGKYYAEILRTEGLNEFAVADIGAVSTAVLSAYDVVILAGPTPLTSAQATMFSGWVNTGGNLIAMQPDAQLFGLLGIASTGSTLSDRYLRVDTSTAVGNGIVGQPIQFHGTAALYSVSGASTIATLYTNPTTATGNPAVTLQNVGTNGGHAAAFAYDLATSIVFMRQGNPAWAAQERDGFTPIRSDDKFYGAATGDPQPDWVDLNNEVSIPQADEQQRLLVNLIVQMNLTKRPLPRFWYFPFGKKAVVIMTGDDHGNGGTAGRFDEFIAASPSGCNVANWECIRSTSYIYSEPANLSNTQAANYTAQGFEVGLHINTDCADFTPATLDTFYSQQISGLMSSYPSIPAPITMRHHCIVWSDWVTAAKTQLKYGIRLDTSYYFWPPTWVQDRPGHFTGSAMPMRFADLDGSLIDVYNVVSQMTDESGQSYPATSDALLSAAIGPQGFYGAYTVNAHTDSATNPVADGVLSSAVSRGVPVVSSVQMLHWLDARNNSSFGAINWTGNTLNFAVAPAAGANGLLAMVPMSSSAGRLGGITGPSGPVAFTADTIKGIQYAFFSAAAGTYAATYAADTTPPTVISTAPVSGATAVSQAATVTATFSEPIDATTVNTSTFLLRDPSNTLVPATVTYTAATNTAVLTPTNPLAASTTYTATLTTGIKDISGNALSSNFTWSFTTAAAPTCPCSAWSPSTTPGTPAVNDPNAVELGVKFRVDLNGFITGIRFYKGTTNTGTHIGSLWTTAGARLATATFINETPSGWQQVNFSSPVAVTANTVYVASYYAPAGNYAANNNYFAVSGVDNPPVHLLQDGVSGGNGVYAYSASSTFPSNTFQSSNYWVDIVFTTSTAPAPLSVTSTSPASNATGVSVGTTVTATFNNSLNVASANGSTFTLKDASNVTVSGTVTASGNTATLTPGSPLSASTTYTATITTGVTDVNGSSLTANYTWTFTTAAANACTAPPNAIVAENCLAGNPSSEWDISGAGDSSIQGFATDISVNQGGTINFKINTPATAYRLDIYRMGYYGGNGARKVATVSGTGPQNQLACLTNSTTGLIDCGNWSVSSSWTVPANATSGIYFAKAVRTDTGGASHIFFIVRNDASHSDILFQTSDTTWQAYNDYGGNNLYTGGPGTSPSRAYKVSYNRPFHTRVFEPESWVFNAEYPMVRWLEANGYDVSYFTGIDAERNAALILNHKVWTSHGHDEYWSGGERASIQAARDAGVHLAFFSGNTTFWKTRWENSIDGSNTPFRTMVCYKETHANAVIDPSDPPTWTGTWRDPRFSPPADGGQPENALVGTLFRMNGGQNGTITVPQAEGRMRFWRNTSVATLGAGQQATLAPGTIGAEFDDDEDNGFRPAGLFGLSSTPITDSSNVLLDFGSTYGAGTVTHKMTLYKAPSRAWVFAAGTYQWSWGLDSNHDRTSLGSTTDVRMQQATVNLFADMGVQPATIQAGLTPATASTDATLPASTITAPAAGATLSIGSPVTLTGTAADAGGVVAAVEVSVDGGITWHPATGRASWTYVWTPTASGSVTIKSRAVDDSGNLENPGAGVAVTVGSGGGGTGCTTNCTIWPSTTAPGNADGGADSPVELGVKFTSDVDGTISAIRFYKASTNTGTHIANLWSSTGTLLASATFTSETASGWQQVNFPTPVSITASTVYTASYHTNVGHYGDDQNYFASTGVNSPPLHALQNGVSGGLNGVFAYGSTSTFPNQVFNATNYWVDVVFNSAAAPTLTSIAVTPANPAILVGATQQFTATGTYSDSSTKNITSQATWSSSTATVATISSAGLATGVAAGTTTISATLNGVTGSTVLTVQPAALSVATASLPNGTIGVAYSATLAASGGTPPYTWSVTTGTLPGGLTLNATTGAITGTPSVVGTSTFTIQVTDSAAPAGTATKNLSITIAQPVANTGFLAPSANAPVTTGAGDNNGFQTTPTNAYVLDGAFAVDANSGTSTSTSCTNTGKDKHDFFNYSIGLPGGAVIQGIEVRLDALVNSTTSTPMMCVQLSWDGGTTWTAAQTTPTLSTTNTTYVLGGAANNWGRTWTTAELTNANFRVRVINVASSTARTFSLDWLAVRVTYQGSGPALTSIAITPANPTVAAGGTQQFTATGTYSDSSTQNITSNVTWASSNTAVATVNSTGLATSVGGGTATISAGQGGVTGSTVLSVFGITTTSLATGTVGASYSAALAAANGTPPYTWSITGGGLPPGVNMDAAGNISGTPTANGAFTFTAQVTDSSAPSLTASKSLTVSVVTSTVFLAPTTNAPVTSGAGDNNGFETTPTNAYVLDGLFAVDANSGTNTSTSCTNTGKDKHDFFTYNVNLPTGVAIQGIEVQLNAKVSSTVNTPMMCVQLSWNGGTTWTTAQSTPTLSTATATYVLGGTANNWGRSWAATDLTNANFRVRVIDVAASTARTFSLDWLAVRITYQ